MIAGVLLLGLGCQSPELKGDDTESVSSDSTTPSTSTEDSGESAPYLGDDEAMPPDVDLDSLGAELTTLLDGLFTYNAVPVFEVYESLLARGTSSCPLIEVRSNSSYWNETCTTPDGVTFDGYLSRYTAGSGQGLSASAASISTPEGDTLILDGEFFYTRQENGNVKSYESTAEGTARWEGQVVETDWLHSGRDAQLLMEARESFEVGPEIQLSGRLLGLEGTIEAFVVNGQSSLYQDGACSEEPSGDLTLLVDGVWVDLFFDGPATVKDPVEDGCDGCGSAWANGYELGEVCIDTSGLWSWAELGQAPF